jgi:outer membrane receptor protein involved in Fe transport
VYGADAVGGVVNFIMDRDFEGVKGGFSFSGFNHNNDNDLAQGIQADKGFSSPSGSAYDGNMVNGNLAFGGKFADGRGHAVLYLDYRDSKAVNKGQRDYTNCSVSGGGDTAPVCSGSSTSDTGRFEIYRPDGTRYGSYTVDTSGSGDTWKPRAGYVWNFAPYNYLQRPDTRWAAGGFLDYEFNEHATGYLEVGFMNDKTDAQIAPSGDFFGNTFELNVDNPMLSEQQRNHLLAAGWGAHDIATVIIGRRSVESGGRVDHLSHNSWRFVAGLKGDINEGWSYDVSGLLAQVSAPESYQNDFNTRNIQDALIVDGDPNDASTWQCRSGNAGCVPWNIFKAGGVTQEALGYLQLALLSEAGTATNTVTATLTGDLGKYGLTIPSAAEGIQVAVGADYGRFSMYFRPDQAYIDGIGAGQGGTAVAVDGSYNVKELFAEALIPIIQEARFAKDLSLELGYRWSDYSTSGGWPTYKAQASWAPSGSLRFRTGVTRATRSPNVIELFNPQSYGLGGSTDPCAGETPAATLAQCALTGVTAAQYGTILENPAGQYQTLNGGNPLLDPEVANTVSFGTVFTPMGTTFSAAVDYYKITVDDTVGALRADDIINYCLETGNPALCNLINRDRFGSLWIVQGTAGSTGAGYTEATNLNIGTLYSEGVDLNLSYVMPLGNSMLSYNLIGTYLLQNKTDTGLYAYDCVGYFGDLCNNFYGVAYGLTPEWRHLARVSWSMGSAVVSLGWRMLSEMTHESASSDPGLSDPDSRDFWEANGSYKIPAAHYFDLAFNYKLWEGVQFTVGVNNILDKEPPLGSGIDNIDYGPGFWGAYDVYGRYLFSSIQFAF